jgi:hypothetical protein
MAPKENGPKAVSLNHFFLLTAALKPAPAENLGTVAAAIFSFSPVRGFLPVRAARLAALESAKADQLNILLLFHGFDNGRQHCFQCTTSSGFIQFRFLSDRFNQFTLVQSDLLNL